MVETALQIMRPLKKSIRFLVEDQAPGLDQRFYICGVGDGEARRWRYCGLGQYTLQPRRNGRDGYFKDFPLSKEGTMLTIGVV